MVLTHEDSDHIGGALSVLESMEVASLASSLPRAHPLHTLVAAPRRCAAGTRWEWDGVRFEFLHPADDAPRARRNDQSCVLRVAARGGSMLLTGDVERAAELSMINQNLRSDVLLVPHHGSRTSSSAEFIAAIAPRWAVIAVGYRSRFGHPSAEVLRRYEAAGTQVMRTDLDGAVHIFLEPQGLRLSGERARASRYWRRAPRG